jgi:hypothetical protein
VSGRCGATAAGTAALAAARWATPLESLDLDGQPLDAAGARALAAGPLALRACSIGGVDLDAGALQALAAAAAWPLETLALREVDLAGTEAGALAALAARFPRLLALDLSESELSDAALRTVCCDSAWPALEECPRRLLWAQRRPDPRRARRRGRVWRDATPAPPLGLALARRPRGRAAARGGAPRGPRDAAPRRLQPGQRRAQGARARRLSRPQVPRRLA